MRRMIGVFFLLTFCLAVSTAQQAKPLAADKWDVFAGYSFSRIYAVNESPFPMNLTGGQGAVTYNFTRHLGATAEVAGYTNDVDGTTVSTEGYLFGPTARFGLKNGKSQKVSFFAHQLFGVTHMAFTVDDGESCNGGTSATCSTHPFTMASGGGIDFKVSKHIWIRPLQVEYFNEQVSLDSIGAFAVGVGPTPRSNAHPDAKMSTGIRITAQGMRYAGGAVYRF